MKKTMLLTLLPGVFLFFSLNHLAAQDKKPAKVTITITENDKVTTDTTFELKEGQDPEMIKKMISHISGEDAHMVLFSDKGHAKMLDLDDHVIWSAKKGGDFEFHFDDLGIDLDSVKEAHGGQKIMVMKDEDGNFTIRELGEDQEIIKSKDHSVIITTGEGDDEGEENVEVYVIKKGDKDMKVVKKTVKVEIEDENGEVEQEGN